MENWKEEKVTLFPRRLFLRLAALALAAVLALSIALPVFASDDGDTIYINSVSDLLSLARNCAYDQWSVGKTVILQKDLSLEGMLWEPIPSFSGPVSYTHLTLPTKRIV